MATPGCLTTRRPPSPTLPWTRSATTVNLQGQPDGVHYFHVRARGLGGVWGPTAHRQVKSDATTPSVSDLASSSHPDPGTWYGATSASFDWDASGGPSGFAYSWSLDQSPGGQSDDTIDGATPAVTMGGLEEGVWYFHVRARSGAGLWSDTGSRQIRVDSQAPSIAGLTCTPHGDEHAWYIDDDPSFSWSGSDGGSGVRAPATRGCLTGIPARRPTPSSMASLRLRRSSTSATASGTCMCGPWTASAAGAPRPTVRSASTATLRR